MLPFGRLDISPADQLVDDGSDHVPNVLRSRRLVFAGDAAYQLVQSEAIGVALQDLNDELL